MKPLVLQGVVAKIPVIHSKQAVVLDSSHVEKQFINKKVLRYSPQFISSLTPYRSQ